MPAIIFGIFYVIFFLFSFCLIDWLFFQLFAFYGICHFISSCGYLELVKVHIYVCGFLLTSKYMNACVFPSKIMSLFFSKFHILVCIDNL